MEKRGISESSDPSRWIIVLISVRLRGLYNTFKKSVTVGLCFFRYNMLIAIFESFLHEASTAAFCLAISAGVLSCNDSKDTSSPSRQRGSLLRIANLLGLCVHR